MVRGGPAELLLRRAFCFRGGLLARGAPVCPLVHDDMATAAGSGVAPRAAAPPLIPVATQRRRAKWPPPIPFLEQGRPAQRRRPSSKGPRTRPRSRPQRQSDPRSRPEPLDASRDSAGACATDPSTSLARTRAERSATNTATGAGRRRKVEVVSGAPRADLMGRPRRSRHRPYGGRAPHPPATGQAPRISEPVDGTRSTGSGPVRGLHLRFGACPPAARGRRGSARIVISEIIRTSV